ncbi:MAG: hypothetical protein V7719_02680 [Psychroserpens sp.]|uniref:hypothetical protein n=1 Tax=Psychroserpens sp. TaxID=2020870 RepID=UPI003003097B
MRFSIISLVVVLLFSCAIPTVKGLPEFNSTINQFSNPYFTDVNTDYVYKAKISAYDNVFGGILIIKKIKENNHRIVFTTNFGNKIFDFELINNEVKMHFIMEELNRKIITKTLTRDFKTLTQEHNNIQKKFKKSLQETIYQSKTKNRYNHYIVVSNTNELKKIIHTSHSKEKISITFNKVQNNIAKTINIHHKNAPIKIDLDYLGNN